MTARADSGLPTGFGIALDKSCRRLDDSVLFGGSPARAMRLSAAGRTAFAQLEAGPVATPAMAALARRLTDAGLAHPRPPRPRSEPDVTVLIPVRDRAGMLERCLTALGRKYPVVVVDDGSLDPAAVADVAARHGAIVLPRTRNGGPGPARNTGLARIATELVALLDSDCIPAEGWIDSLAAHLADPLVAIAAPRIRASSAASTTASRFAAVRGGLDLGRDEARVHPLTKVAYVPTAALVARRMALLDVAHGGQVFDPALRWGEDVDLVWRLHESGWRIRYDPSIEVGHSEPSTWPALLARRFHYGTSAGALAQRHPAAMAPLILYPGPTVAVAGVLARRPDVVVAGYAAAVATAARTTRSAGLPDPGVRRAMLSATWLTGLGIGRYATQFASPAVAAALAMPGRPTGANSARRRRGRRLALAALVLGPALTTWAGASADLDPVRFTAGQLADDVAYGAGVWVGCIRNRTLTPLRPVLRRNTAQSKSAVPERRPAHESEFHRKSYIQPGNERS